MKKTKTYLFKIQLLIYTLLLLVGKNICLSQTPALEYSKYKKEGDKFYEQGSYDAAIRNYILASVEDGYENEKYINEQIVYCRKCINSLTEAEKAINEGNLGKAIISWKEVLNLNAKDNNTKSKLSLNLELYGDKLFDLKKFDYAKIQYIEAIKYNTLSQEIIHVKIKKCDTEINKAEIAKQKAVLPVIESQVGIFNDSAKNADNETPKEKTNKNSGGGVIQTKYRTKAPKIIVTTMVGLGGGAYAYMLNNNWNSKVNAYNIAKNNADALANRGYLAGTESYNKYKIAYDNMAKAKKNHGIFLASLGVSALAGALDIIFIVKKPKSKVVNIGLNNSNSGLAISYIINK